MPQRPSHRTKQQGRPDDQTDPKWAGSTSRRSGGTCTCNSTMLFNRYIPMVGTMSLRPCTMSSDPMLTIGRGDNDKAIVIR